jgi:hypothetical protein
MGVAAKRHAKRKAAKARANASEEPQVRARARVGVACGAVSSIECVDCVGT